jgi:O-antigen/teichoic acid export membrane protein
LLRPDYQIQNAYYGFVQRIMDMAYLLPTFLLNSTLPLLAERDARGEDTRSMTGKTFLLILLIGSVTALFAGIWARPLMALLTREAYLSTVTHAGADTALRLLSVPMLCGNLILFSFYTLLTRHRWKPLVSTLGVGVVVAIICNFFLITKLGFVGAAYTSNIVHILLSVLLLPQAFRAMPARTTARQFVMFVLFVLLLAPFLWFTLPLLTSTLRTVLFLAVAGVWMTVLGWVLGMKNIFFEMQKNTVSP